VAALIAAPLLWTASALGRGNRVVAVLAVLWLCAIPGVQLAIRLGVLRRLFPILANSRHKTLIYLDLERSVEPGTVI
jgi:hypothetical protein